ncbi:splicing factor 3a, subunit 1 [Thermoascus aurantiacus ATCC 26904]
MAPSTVNGNATATSNLPEEVTKPPEGVVLPPKDIRAIIEKTAGYVARNGLIFEDRVREKERNNPKFSFLNPSDAYAAFYRWRLTEIKEGRGTAISAGRPGEAAAAPEPEKPKGPVEPPAFHFSARIPIINAQDLEVVKLTALFVAKRGKSFMTTLSQRETRNYQFDFLRPQHSLYQFFTRLVDQYTILLRPEGTDGSNSEKQRLAELERNVKDKYHILDRAKQRADWVKYQEQQKQKKEEEEEQERIAYAQIDWHDFVVVETVLFTEADDQAELPPPTSLNDLQSASLEQKAMMSLNSHNLRIEEAMPTDEETPTYYNAYPAERQVTTPTQPSFDPSSPSLVSQTQPQRPSKTAPMDHSMPQQTTTPPVSVSAEGGDRPIGERAEAPDHQAAAKTAPGQQPMRIRSDYVPRAQARRLNTAAATALCPNCHQQIPVAELEHHMRIELLDPRWKEQRAKAESRSATTNLSTADVVNNLKRLASQRSDVFDSTVLTGTSADGPNSEEEARRKRIATGHEGGPPMPTVGPAGAPPNPQSMNIEEQIRQIHERYKQ